MERHTADIFCFFVLFLVSLVFVFDLFGATGAALKKKDYKSMIGSFVEKLSDSGLWWFPLLVALFYIYGFYISVNFLHQPGISRDDLFCRVFVPDVFTLS